MPTLELIANVGGKADERWCSPSVMYAIRTAASLATYEKRYVRALSMEESSTNSTSVIRKAVAKYPIKYIISPKLETSYDAECFIKGIELVKHLVEPIYVIRSEELLRSIPQGSHVCITEEVSYAFNALTNYNVWIQGSRDQRKTWLAFCELVVRGVIPVGVFLPSIKSILNSKRRYNRDLRRYKVDSYDQRDIEASVQNIISFWETISSQMDRIARAKR